MSNYLSVWRSKDELGEIAGHIEDDGPSHEDSHDDPVLGLGRLWHGRIDDAPEK